MVLGTTYGRLDFILALALSTSVAFNIPDLQLHVLAHITKAKGTVGDASDSMISYRQIGRPIILDVKSVESVVGRVETKGVVGSGEWFIIDRGTDACRMTFNEVDDIYDEE